ncbi:hypothetical protein HN51_067658 [Arachis hypogaea]|uniref:Transmembrane protein n=1 Tax=Arachis hypogaea TaxID=3818 RepID=A0A444ZQ71_ARAHY|nr:uncharacterized protein LOC107635287 [Arachis ipaensis]XP_025649853.1 uncharacterized protein LOC112744439 [Arachis hypogaea]QHO09104.1 uncharacterized protein DS421_14g478380 [Arachis hypogaea]RYR16351.1 hypothetical protein Ahy_B04g073349 [Arachis hypogaea]
METTSLSSHFILTRHLVPSSRSHKHKQFLQPQQNQHQLSLRFKCSSSNNDNSSGLNSSSVQAPTDSANDSAAVGVRFRRRSSRRQSRKQENNNNDGGVATRMGNVKSAPKKKWEEMTLNEKAVELYMGEKGALFWLNKFAYASIFIMIGAWILFRFVGPALNLYQLDSQPLNPSDVFKGS